jgi:hypothetical protein
VAQGVPVGVGPGVVVVGVGPLLEMVSAGEGPGVVGDRLGLVPVGPGADEEDTPAGPGLFGVSSGQCRYPAPLHGDGPLEAETACMAGTVAQAVRTDAAPMAARTVWARDNLIIGKRPFGRAPGRLPYADCGGDSGVTDWKALRLPAQTRTRAQDFGRGIYPWAGRVPRGRHHLAVIRPACGTGRMRQRAGRNRPRITSM